MQHDLVLHDEDLQRDYHVCVGFKVRREIGGDDTKVICDIENVSLDKCVVWLSGCGMEVEVDIEHLRVWERELEREYAEEIREKCIEWWDGGRFQNERNVA